MRWLFTTGMFVNVDSIIYDRLVWLVSRPRAIVHSLSVCGFNVHWPLCDRSWSAIDSPSQPFGQVNERKARALHLQRCLGSSCVLMFVFTARMFARCCLIKCSDLVRIAFRERSAIRNARRAEASSRPIFGLCAAPIYCLRVLRICVSMGSLTDCIEHIKKTTPLFCTHRTGI